MPRLLHHISVRYQNERGKFPTLGLFGGKKREIIHAHYSNVR